VLCFFYFYATSTNTVKKFFLIALVCMQGSLYAQDNDSIMILRLFETALARGDAYQNLEVLCRDYPKRLAGSPGAAGAVDFTRKIMDKYGLDSVWLQPCMVPHWVRGEKETAQYIGSNSEKKSLAICALGNSIGTGDKGITGSLIEVKSFKELDSLGKKNIAGKIVYYSHPMDQTKISPFEAYGEGVEYRWAGAERAAKYGAIAVVIRSVGTALDDFPHTGSMHYTDSIPKIPACALSTLAAEELNRQLKKDPATKFYFRQTCEMLKDEPSFNVIGEIRGSENPKMFITVGGHLDAWETGDGAHDDGAGVVQSMEVLHLFKLLGMKPRYTIRAVLFMNEENGGRGGTKYADEAKAKKEKHLFALETDAGGFSPKGFIFEGDTNAIAKIKTWRTLFAPYGIYNFDHSGSGADVGHLKDYCKVLSGLMPDPQRYFDYHHAASDTFDKVNRRELEMGAASLAALIYLVDKRGL
jgi:hypothetical protein